MATLKRMFTDDEVFNLFRDALKVVERLDPPDDLRVPTFSGVVNMLGQHEMAPGILGATPFPGARLQ